MNNQMPGMQNADYGNQGAGQYPQSNASVSQNGPYTQPPVQPQQPKGTSGLAVAGLVLGIVAILTSFVPIVNNMSFLLALIGLILGIIGFVQTRKGKKTGAGIGIASIVLNILSCIIVLATQSFYGAVLDEAVNNVSTTTGTVVSSSSQAVSQSADAQPEASSASSTPAASETSDDTSNLAIGTSVDVGDGLQVTVNSVTGGLKDYDDSSVTQVSVTYVNTGSKNESFNLLDWKAESPQGVQTSTTIYLKGENTLGSGDLTPGGTVSGNVYFDGDVTKVLYFDNIFSQTSSVSWAV